MAGVFQKALRRLDSTPLEAIADTLSFETIDPGRLAERLELQRHGTERGKKNQPASRAKTFDSIEHTIITEIEEYHRRAIDRVTRSLEAYSARLRAFEFEQARIEIIAAINEAKANFLAEVHQGANELYQKRRTMIDATKDAENFKHRHRLQRQAHHPDSRFWIWGVLVGLFFVEAVLNSMLFAGGLPGGFLEGFSIAIIIAFINVIVGFAIGLYVVRFLLYQNLIIQLLAAVGLALDLAFNSFINLVVARFRTALGNNDPEAALISAFGVPPLEVFQRLTEIVGFQSYILIVVGILFHIIAMFDGFKFDDPYPFYGKYSRKREEAETDYTETKEQLINSLTNQRDKAIDEMENTSRSLSTSRKLAAQISENRHQTQQRFETYLDNLEQIANQLLALYREANSDQRTSKAPSHFGNNWSFPSRHQTHKESNGTATLFDDDIAKRTQEDLETGVVDVNEKYVEAVTTYQKIETMLEEKLANAEKAA